MAAHVASQNLARAGALIDEAGRLIHEHRPMLEAAAMAVMSAPFPIWVLDRRSRLLACNREFEAVVHATFSEMRGRTLVESIGTLPEAFTAEDEAVMTTARSRLYLGTLDGEARERRFFKWPLFGEDGGVIGVCGGMT